MKQLGLEYKRTLEFYSGQQWIIWKETWLGRVLPKWMHQFFPWQRLGKWGPEKPK